MKKFLTAAVLAIVASLALGTQSAQAVTGAVRLEPPVRSASPVKFTYVQYVSSTRVWVEFNTGSLWSLPTCKYEDSANCYWDAQRQGNGRGRSFVHLKGKTYYR